MAQTVQDILRKAQGGAATPAPMQTPIPAGDLDFEHGEIEGVFETREIQIKRGPNRVSVRVNAIITGILMDVTLDGIEPQAVGDYIRGIDPSAQFQTEFPKRGGFGGGAKDVKTAILNSVTVKGGKFPGVDMVLVGDDAEAISVTVSKNRREQWPQDFARVASPEKVEKVKGLLGGTEGSDTTLSFQLADGKPVAVKYSMYEGKGYFEGLEVQS